MKIHREIIILKRILSEIWQYPTKYHVNSSRYGEALLRKHHAMTKLMVNIIATSKYDGNNSKYVENPWRNLRNIIQIRRDMMIRVLLSSFVYCILINLYLNLIQMLCQFKSNSNVMPIDKKIIQYRWWKTNPKTTRRWQSNANNRKYVDSERKYNETLMINRHKMMKIS